MLDGNGVTTNYTYDAKTRRLQTLKAGDFQNLQYMYDPVGNITMRSSP